MLIAIRVEECSLLACLLIISSGSASLLWTMILRKSFYYVRILPNDVWLCFGEGAKVIVYHRCIISHAAR